MQRQRSKQKKHGKKRLWVSLSIFVVVVGLIVFGGVQFERSVVAGQAATIVSKAAPISSSSLGTSLADVELAPRSASEISDKLNESSSTLISESNGLFDSAEATVSGSTVTETLTTSKLNSLLVNTAMTTNGDQVQTMADKVLTSMQSACEKNPKLIVNITNTDGKVIKTLTYSK